MSMNVNENGDITRATVASSENVLTNVAIDRPYTIPVADVCTIEIPLDLQIKIAEMEALIEKERNRLYQATFLQNYLQKLTNEKSNNTYITNKKEGKMTYKYEKCSCCGRKKRDYNLLEVNGEKVCRDCRRSCYIPNYFNRNELIKAKDPKTGEYALQQGYALLRGSYGTTGVARISELIERGYKLCPKCNRFEKESEMITVNGQKVCRSCKPYYYEKCNHCGEYHDRHSMTQLRNGYYVCRKCRDEFYVRCPQCGSYHLIEDMITRNGRTMCEDCYRQMSTRCIHCYHDSAVTYHKLYTPNDNPNDINTCYFGFELEVSGDKTKAMDFLSVENIDREVVLMSDSSIKNGGFEIVTMPMTKNYIDEVFMPKFTGALKFLRDNDFKGHNYGGLHIHISQDAVTNKQIAQLSEILYGNVRDQRIWLGITQRKNSEMQNWSGMTNRIGDFFNAYSQPDSQGKASVGSPRYTALCKDDRTKTYEFRIFNSNIRIERFKKNYECVLALLDYTKLNENNPLPVCNTVGFINYVYDNQDNYEELYKFFVERRIKEHYKDGYSEFDIERVA